MKKPSPEGKGLGLMAAASLLSLHLALESLLEIDLMALVVREDTRLVDTSLETSESVVDALVFADDNLGQA